VKRLGSVLFWSVISAAFIGPGTVTTAASAGAGFGFSLLWALSFSTVACVVLQEASARITVLSGHDLGQALRLQYPRGVVGVAVVTLVLGSVVLGCAAYEAGNILGGVAGAALGTGGSTTLLTWGIGAAAAAILLVGRTATIARLLGLFVAVMGVAFLVTAVRLRPDSLALVRGAVVPAFPDGSGLLILGLVGTTVVPYNLFLGSGIARGQALSELRFGLCVAVVLGGVVSMGIVVAGTALEGGFDFAKMASVLDGRLGPGARALFAAGLCAAGVSSAITAPLAAAVTARSLLAGPDPADGPWADDGWGFRATCLSVLAIGVGFGVSGIRPVPAILAAQALNGVLLPVVAVFLLLGVNDRRLVGANGLNGAWANACTAGCVAVTVLLGTTHVARAVAGAVGIEVPGQGRLVVGALAVAGVAAIPVWRRASSLRRAETARFQADRGLS